MSRLIAVPPLVQTRRDSEGRRVQPPRAEFESRVERKPNAIISNYRAKILVPSRTLFPLATGPV